MIRCLSVIVVAGFACARAFAAAPTTSPASRPVAGVWYEQSGMTIPGPGEKFVPQRLIVGVWSDGTVVWSDNRATGGEPYWTARVGPELVDKLVNSLETVGFFEPSKVSGFGPDASITMIAAEVGERRRRVGSWHQPPTTRPNLVFSEHGIGSVEPAVPKPQPSPEYQRFLDVWSESRRLIESVVPERSGQPAPTLDERVFRTAR